MLDTDTYKETETLDATLHIRLPKEEKLRLEQIGKPRDRKASYIAREAIRRYLKEKALEEAAY